MPVVGAEGANEGVLAKSGAGHRVRSRKHDDYHIDIITPPNTELSTIRAFRPKNTRQVSHKLCRASVRHLVS